MIRTARIGAAFLLTLWVARSAALAQLPQHRLQAVYPAGAQAGSTIELQVTGADLERADGLWFDHPGLHAFRRKPGVFVVAVAPGTPAGLQDLRVTGPLGVSNPRVFAVGDRPETAEVEPNNTPDKANPIRLNTVVNGRSDASPDVDWFAFEAKAGQRVLIELAAEPLDSRFDGVLRLIGPAGRELALDHDQDGTDPFLDQILPADGRYAIEVRDVVYSGSPEHVYRLSLHDGPHLEAVAPVIAAAGTTTEFALFGRNLPGGQATDRRLDGRPLEQVRLTLPVPEAKSAAPDRYLYSTAAARLGFEVRWPGALRPLFVAAADDPVVIEAEPNDAQHPQTVSLPCEVAAAFDAPGDADVFRFEAKAGAVWVIEAQAERIGSPADPSLVIQQVGDGGKVQDLTTADDTAEPPFAGDARFPTASADARIRWQAPADGTYQVVVTDLFGSQRGDVRFAYRLHIHPERPDARVYVVPDDPAQPGAVNLGVGGRATARLVAQRFDGFNGPILVEPAELPSGVNCEPVVIGTGQTTAPLVLAADLSARPTIGVASLVASTRRGDRKEVLDHAPGARIGPEVRREVIPGGMIRALMPINNGPTAIAPARVTRGLVVAVVGEAPFRLDARPARIVAGPGESLELTAEVHRHPTMTEAVAIALSDLPPKVPAANATIANDATSATLKLTIPADAPAGNYTIVLRGTGPFPFRKDPAAKDPISVNVNEPSNPILLSIHR